MRNSTAVKEDARQLLADLRALGLEAEKLIENSATEMSENAMSRLRQQFGTAQERFSELYGTARAKTIAGAKYTDEVVRANPYSSVGVGAGIGLLAGFLIGRSLHSD
jgi:ElaB/YqjD/DUF883 family membrane-anchored ribosome-binding protein